ncbi:hypothetical protein [Spiroplasma poulsonii]|uniref:hypothetical protein n=1 Tax=Spiroplasma poulsonii TaxID=2138 RepID=UPI000D6715B5|nr:hypothetical protein [Spiroplasma poulsonii]PWF95848.1 hypothetical protein SMSE_12850 [Spiroplasma poulsonii]
MNPYLEQKAGVKLAEKLTELKKTDLASPNFALVKKSNRWLSDIFDQEINNFYDKKLKMKLWKLNWVQILKKKFIYFIELKLMGMKD